MQRVWNEIMEKDKIIVVSDNKKDYLNYWISFGKKQINFLPVYCKNINELEEQVSFLNSFCTIKEDVNKVDYAIDISNLKEMFDIAKNEISSFWGTKEHFLKNSHTYKDVLLFGLYEDFKYSNLGDFFLYCYLQGIPIYCLIARNESSLSWLLVRQFLDYKTNDFRSIFTYQRVGNKSLIRENIEKNSTWCVNDIEAIKKINIKEKIYDNVWDTLIFHGHGKEDNLNLDDYTLCGNNSLISSQSVLFPSCGYCHQECFKSTDKLIDLKKVKSKNLILLSCNNFTFFDLSLYDYKYSLGLNAIDSIFQNITLSVGVHSTEIHDIEKYILYSNNHSHIPSLFHVIEQEKHRYPFLIQIGLPQKKQDNVFNFQTDELQNSKGDLTNINIINRLYFFAKSFLLDDQHIVKKNSNNILSTIENSYKNNNYYEGKKIFKELLNKANALSIIMMNEMINSNEDGLHDFYDYCIARSKIEKIQYGFKCSCGEKSIYTRYVGMTTNVLNIESITCYRCGDKELSMIHMPKISVFCDPIIRVGDTLKIKCNIKPQEKGNIHVSNILPKYIQNYRKNPPKTHKIKNNSYDKEYVYEDTIEFNENIPCQAYYVTLIIVQNAGISISRVNFNIVGEFK